ncbi:MAG: hypothetical protein PUG48_06335 [Clostridia bacterium]|nr:hypothetical protein [Clostridia bacterium]
MYLKSINRLKKLLCDDEENLDLTAILDEKLAYSNEDFVVISAPTN